VQGPQTITTYGGQRTQRQASQSRQARSKITASGVAKAASVILGTTATYYLAKATGIFSYFGSASDAKSDHGVTAYHGNNLAVMENGLKIIDHSSRPTVSQNGLRHGSKEAAMPFEELKVEKITHKNFGGRSLLESTSVEKAEALSVQNPIPDQNITIGTLFKMTIDGSSVFNSSTIFLNPTALPSWLSATNPMPKSVGSCTTSDAPGVVTVSGNYAFVSVAWSGFQIIDISNPIRPRFKGSYNNNNPSNDVYGLTISGNYVYVADASLGLQIIDVSNVTNPTFKGSYDTPGFAVGVTVSGNYAYVADGGHHYVSGLQIIDISNPASPTFKGSYNTPGSADDVTVLGNYAYIADKFSVSGIDSLSSLQIIDISNPASPIFKGSYNALKDISRLTVSGNYAYVIGSVTGLRPNLHIIDITNVTNPTFKGSFDIPGSANHVTLSGNYAFVTNNKGYPTTSGGLQIIDISDPVAPKLKGSYNMPTTSRGATGVTVSGNYAYVAGLGSVFRSGFLQIIDPGLSKINLAGTPTAAGRYTVGIVGCNELNECTTDNFDIIVSKSPKPPKPPTPPIPPPLNFIVLVSITGVAVTTGVCCLFLIGSTGIGIAVVIAKNSKKDTKNSRYKKLKEEIDFTPSPGNELQVRGSIQTE